jgi:hypothetical protein
MVLLTVDKRGTTIKPTAMSKALQVTKCRRTLGGEGEKVGGDLSESKKVISLTNGQKIREVELDF